LKLSGKNIEILGAFHMDAPKKSVKKKTLSTPASLGRQEPSEGGNHIGMNKADRLTREPSKTARLEGMIQPPKYLLFK
jgi:hypothetical protein